MYIPSFLTCLSVYILTKSEFISSCSRPAVGSNIVKITRATVFVNVLKKMTAGSHFGCKKTLFIALLTISDRYHNFNFCDFFHKMAAGGHFGCPKFTFDRISGYFISIGHFGCPKFTFDHISGHFRSIWIFFRRRFWMSEIHFGSHFWLFHIDRPFWMSEIHFRSHFWTFTDQYGTFDIFLNF